VVRSLAPHLSGRRVTGVEVRERRLRGDLPPEFAVALTGRRIERLDRHGKYLLATLDDRRLWLIHLGMTGRLTLEPVGRGPERHDHVLVGLDDGKRLTYSDPRRFGRMAVIDPAHLGQEAGRGLNALSPTLTPEVLFGCTRGRRTPIKALLMDQRRIAGLGNIYANEILFRAGVRPRRRAGGLRRADCARVVAATRAVLADAIRRGGSSISDYVDGLGRRGWFQLRHSVYDRAGAPCRRCTTPVRRCLIVGRASYYCPRCQT